MIISIDESKTWTKYTPSNGRCIFDGGKCNVNQNWNSDKCQCKGKIPIKFVHGKDYTVLINFLIKSNIWNELLLYFNTFLIIDHIIAKTYSYLLLLLKK